MFNSMDELHNETMRMNMELVSQYKKELDDLNKGIGLSKSMSPEEIESAKNMLIDAIQMNEETLKIFSK